MLKVAVKLPALTGDVGEYLADVTALEAAGADAIWVDDNALEPWVMLGALGAVTHRVGLGYRLTSPDLWPAARLGPSAAAIQTLSRGRLVVGLPPQGAHEDQLAALRSAGARIFSVGSPSASADGVILAAESAGQLSGVAGAGALVASGLGFEVALAESTKVKQNLRIAGAKESHSVCPYCAVGCSLVAYTRQNN